MMLAAERNFDARHEATIRTLSQKRLGQSLGFSMGIFGSGAERGVFALREAESGRSGGKRFSGREVRGFLFGAPVVQLMAG